MYCYEDLLKENCVEGCRGDVFEGMIVCWGVFSTVLSTILSTVLPTVLSTIPKTCILSACGDVEVLF